MGTLHEDQYIFLIILHSFLLRIRNVSDIFTEKIKTHILHSITIFFKPCHLWDNVVKYCKTRQVTDDNMVYVNCMLPTYVCRQTLRICNSYSFFTAIMVEQTSLSVTLLSCLYDYEMLLLGVKTHPWYICELVTEFGQDSRIGLIAICGTHPGKSCIHKESLLPQVVPFHTILSSPSHFAQSTKHRILL